MFTGIVEETGIVKEISNEGDNITFTVMASMTPELKIDQSVAHNGVCLTVVDLDIQSKTYKVTAIAETLQKSNLGDLTTGMHVNLERAMKYNGRMDGHFVQGHVDRTVICHHIESMNGSTVFTFQYDPADAGYLIEKGSVTLNGVSLTIFNVSHDHFSVAIIPYTFGHTTFNQLKEGDTVNIEFDVIGKYISRQLELIKKQL